MDVEEGYRLGSYCLFYIKLLEGANVLDAAGYFFRASLASLAPLQPPPAPYCATLYSLLSNYRIDWDLLISESMHILDTSLASKLEWWTHPLDVK